MRWEPVVFLVPEGCRGRRLWFLRRWKRCGNYFCHWSERESERWTINCCVAVAEAPPASDGWARRYLLCHSALTFLWGMLAPLGLVITSSEPDARGQYQRKSLSITQDRRGGSWKTEPWRRRWDWTRSRVWYEMFVTDINKCSSDNGKHDQKNTILVN